MVSYIRRSSILWLCGFCLFLGCSKTESEKTIIELPDLYFSPRQKTVPQKIDVELDGIIFKDIPVYLSSSTHLLSKKIGNYLVCQDVCISTWEPEAIRVYNINNKKFYHIGYHKWSKDKKYIIFTDYVTKAEISTTIEVSCTTYLYGSNKYKILSNDIYTPQIAWIENCRKEGQKKIDEYIKENLCQE